MSLFVEVNSVEKNCPVIVNLDQVIEIAPLAAGGCKIFMIDGAGIQVTDSYNQFKQFVLQTVSADDIARRFPKADETTAPPPAKTKKASMPEYDIPKL
jgi:hypothetical protein